MSKPFSKPLILSLFLCCILTVSASNRNEQLRAVELLIEAADIVDIAPERAKGMLDEASKIESISTTTMFKIQSVRAVACENLGQYTEAERSYKQALSLIDVDIVEMDKILLRLAQLYWQIGNYKDGTETLSHIKTESLFTRRNIQLSHMYYGQGLYFDAIALLENTLKDNPNSPDQNDIIQNIGYIYGTMGDTVSALSYFNRAIDNLSGKNDTYEYNILLENIAIVLSQQGKHEEAIKHIKASYDHFTKIGDPHTSLRKYAEVLTRAGRYAEAKGMFAKYFRHEQTKLMENLDKMTLQQRINFWGKEKPLLSKCFMLEDSAPEFLFDVAMFRRQVSLLGIRDTAHLKKALASSAKDVRLWLNENEAAVEIINYTDKNNREAYAAIVLPKVGAAKFVPMLKANDIYQKDALFRGPYSLFETIKNEEVESLNLLYCNSDLGDKIWQPIISVLPPSVKKIFFAPEGIFHIWGIENMAFSNSVNYELYRTSSIASLIHKGRDSQKSILMDKKLIIGGLNYDALPIDSVCIEQPNREASRILKSQYGEESISFNYLAGTKIEADTIAQLVSNVRPYNEMSESKMKSVMNQYKLIHIATHGYSMSTSQRISSDFLVDSLQYNYALSSCGLALSGANVATNESIEDGLLSARELCGLDLSNVDFVVLSACQTAQGDVIDEGAAGLVRGFKNAGAKIVLATLWSVNDLSTTIFMKKFYEKLAKGESPYKALRMAQNHLKENSFYTYRHRFSTKTLAREKKPTRYEHRYDTPHFWAPFILIDAIE